MAKMTPELKARLAEYAARKRARTVRLRDITEADVLMACDYAEERGFDPRLATDSTVSYLSHCPPLMTEALRKRLPHIRLNVGSRVGPRDVYCFATSFINEVLTFLKLSSRKARWVALSRGRWQQWLRANTEYRVVLPPLGL